MPPRVAALAVALVMSLVQLASPVERAIAAAVDAHNPTALALLERAVNINSGTHNFAGVRAVGDLFRHEFDGLGFKTTWVDGAAFHRAGHLIADHPGPGPRIVLVGHLDTVFEQDSPFQKFERLDANTARGPGVIDMKGGDVIVLAAMQALQDAGGSRISTWLPSSTAMKKTPATRPRWRVRRSWMPPRARSTRSGSRMGPALRGRPSRPAAACRVGRWM